MRTRHDSRRWGVALGSGLKMEDSLWAGLTDLHIGLPMGMTAENIAEKVQLLLPLTHRKHGG